MTPTRRSDSIMRAARSRRSRTHHTIKATVKNATTEINGREFALEQFHFHAQSEHTVNGKHFPMEAHFVHVASDGRYAVVGVFIKEGKANSSFGAVLDSVNTAAEPVALADLVPADPDYFHYLGSLTTLTENVEWYVMSAPHRSVGRADRPVHQPLRSAGDQAKDQS